MAIQWGGFSGHMRVGIDVFTDGYDTNTPSINVYVDFYIQCDSTWSFNDSQTLTAGGNVGGSWTFTNNLGANQQMYIGRAIVYGQGQSYGGGPTYYFSGQISGHYQGATPSAGVYFTLPARPPNVPTNPPLSISGVTSNSVNTSVGASDPRGSGIDFYDLVVSLPGGSWSAYSQEFTSSVSRTITGLAPATVYDIAVRAHNGVGYSGWTFSGQFTTGATTPGTPGLPTLANITQVGADVTWTAPGSNGGSAITNYEIQVATDNSFTQNVKTYTVGNVLTTTLSDLTPGTTWYLRVRARNGVGYSSYTGVVTLTTLAGTPVIITPAQGASVGTSIISVVLQALGIASDRTITLQVSQDNTFATGVKTVTLNPPGRASNDQYTLTDTAQYLINGIWYARAKVTNNTSGYVTPWSTTVSWTESHTPSAQLQSPVQSATVKYGATTNLSFKFTDAGAPNDWMTAYQLVIENNLTGAVVYDSTKTALVGDPINTIATVAVALSAALKTTPLRWKVRVWDRGDQVSDYTNYSIFTLADPPVVTITYPQVAIAVTSGAPTITWTVSTPSGGSVASTRIYIRQQATNAIVWDRTITGPVLQVTPETTILQNTLTYSVTVSVTDSAGLNTETSVLFSVAYVAPDPIAYSVGTLDINDVGYINVDWSGQTADTRHVAWRVYRRSLPDVTWQLLQEIPDEAVRTYADFLIIPGQSYQYTVSQVADRSGVLLESPVGIRVTDTLGHTAAESQIVVANILHYWIIVEDHPELSVQLTGVTSNSETEEYDDATFTLIGRGRHRDYGDRLGYTGTITTQIRQPERQSQLKLKIEALRRARENYWLRTPFGRLIPVAIGNLGWEPLAGVGLVEMGNMTIPWEEVA